MAAGRGQFSAEHGRGVSAVVCPSGPARRLSGEIAIGGERQPQALSREAGFTGAKWATRCTGRPHAGRQAGRGAPRADLYRTPPRGPSRLDDEKISETPRVTCFFRWLILLARGSAGVLRHTTWCSAADRRHYYCTLNDTDKPINR